MIPKPIFILVRIVLGLLKGALEHKEYDCRRKENYANQVTLHALRLTRSSVFASVDKLSVNISFQKRHF